MSELLHARTWQAPFGEMLIVTDQYHRLKVLMLNREDRVQKILQKYKRLGLSWRADASSGEEVVHQLKNYFSGELKAFSLELAPEGTPFQQKVWQTLRQIPYGKVLSYGALAKSIGNPKAFRGVGAANGANPICIVIPCHRVIGSDGSLTGFAYGIEVKADLLKREGVAIFDGPAPKIKPPEPDQLSLFSNS